MEHEQVRRVVEAATRAPSVHNSQPWRFSEVAGPDGSPVALDLHADRSRSLDVLDADGRDLHLSCGAALEFASIALRAGGTAVEVALLPDPGDPDLLARIEFTGAEAPAPAEAALYEAIPLRYTERDRFDDDAVGHEIAEELRAEALARGCFLRVLDRPGDEVAVAVLLARADEIERGDDRYEGEVAAWLRDDPSAEDGIPKAAFPDLPVAERASSYKLRDFAPGQPAAERAAGEPVAPPVEHPFVCLIGSDGDDPKSWLAAGQALARVLLRAASHHIQAQPMTQVTEVAPTRAMLSRDLGLVGHPQILLRMGYAHGRPVTGRRPVESVLD